MRTLFLSVALMVLCGASVASTEQALWLSVDPVVIHPRFREPPKDPSVRILMVRAKLYVENRGAVPITIPTFIPPDGEPTIESLTVGPNGRRDVFFLIEFEKRNAKPVQPSAAAFRPVTLQAGEQALVAVWQPKEAFHEPLPDDLHDITFMFKVTEDIAKRFGWWSGELKAHCDFSADRQK